MIQAITSLFASFVAAISDASRTIWDNINVAQYSGWNVALDIFLVAILFYWLIMIIHGSRATNIMLGFIILALLLSLSRWLQLLALGWLLDRLLTVTLVAIPIIFQQELRRGLEKLGRTKFFLAKEAKEMDFIRSEIIEACFDMAKRNVGALIVFKGEVSLKEYVDTGVALYARISKELFLSIFTPGTPLHDGAVIIDQNRILAAGCVLPHSFKEEYGHKFGTRHKAALGLSEATDAAVVVVSEQRGTVAFVNEGEIEENLTPARLEKRLNTLFAPVKSPHYV